MAKIEEQFSEKQLSVILKDTENRQLGRAGIISQGGYMRMIVRDNFGNHLFTFYSSRGLAGLLDELGLGTTRGTTDLAWEHQHEYEIDANGNGIAYVAVHPGNPDVKHQHQVINYQVQEAYSNGWPNTMAIYGVEGAPPHIHQLITGSTAYSQGTGEGAEIETNQLIIYEDEIGNPYVKPNETLEAVKLEGGNYNLTFDTLRNVISQIFGISEKQATDEFPFIIKNISPTRKELRLVFDGNDSVNLQQLQLHMPQVVGVVDDVRANDEEGNLVENGVLEMSNNESPNVRGIPAGGHFTADTFELQINKMGTSNQDVNPGHVTFTGQNEDGDAIWYNGEGSVPFKHPDGTLYDIQGSHGMVSGMMGTNGQGTNTSQDLEAYVMFVGADYTRFGNIDFEPSPSSDFVIAYWDGQQWTYDNDGYSLANIFEPTANDCIVARLFRSQTSIDTDIIDSGITSATKYFTYGVTDIVSSGFTFFEEYDIDKNGKLDSEDIAQWNAVGNIGAASEINAMMNGIIPYPFHNYQFDYVLNLLDEKGEGQLVPILNYLFDNSDPNQSYLIVKLHEPLPAQISRLGKVSIEQKILETTSEQITYIEAEPEKFLERALEYDPDFIKGEVTEPAYAKAESFNDLTGSFTQPDIYQQILSESYDNIQLDFTDFTNHTYFGSAANKLENFKLKISEIEDYYKEISQSLLTSGSEEVNSRRQLLFNKISIVKNGFTPYERFMYQDGQLTTTGSAPGNGPNYIYTRPVNKNDLVSTTHKFGFPAVYEFSGSQPLPAINPSSSVSLFNDTYFVQNEPFYNYSGSLYLSFLMLGSDNAGNKQQIPEWKNNNLAHSPPVPPSTLFTQSILTPSASTGDSVNHTTLSTGSWSRFVYKTSASYWKPHSTNAVVGGAGGIHITASGPQSNVVLVTGENATGSYSIIAGGKYQYLATSITGSGALFTGSMLPAGELFHLTQPSMSYGTSSFITDIKISKNDPTNIAPFNDMQSTASAEFNNWYTGWYQSASLYDDLNPNSLVNNLPAYIKDDLDGNQTEMKQFVNMLGEHFDIIRTYIKGLETFNKRGYDKGDKAPSNILPVLLENVGWEARQIFSGSLLDYFGSNQLQVESPKEITENYWNKTLNNIVPILKSKGTINSVRYLLNVFGWPADVLKIREHGASRELVDSFSILTEDTSPLVDGVGSQAGNFNFTQDKVDLYSFLIHPNTGSKLDLDWWTNDVTANTFQFLMKGTLTNNTQSLVESSGSGAANDNNKTGSFWDLRIIPSGSTNGTDTRAYGKLEFRLNNSLSGSSPIAQNAFSMSTNYIKLKSSEFWNVAIVRDFDNTSYISGSEISRSTYYSSLTGSGLPLNQLKSGSITYKLYVGKAIADVIPANELVSMEVFSNNISGARANENWYSTGSNVSTRRLLVGRTFTGSIAEVRSWTTPLSMSKFKQHILNKQSVVGNHLTSSQDELIYHYKLNENHQSGSTVTLVDSNPFNIKDYSLTLTDDAFDLSMIYDTSEVDRVAFTIRAEGNEINDNSIVIAPSGSLNYISNLNYSQKSYLTPYDTLEAKKKASSKISIIRSPHDVIDDFLINNMSDFSVAEMMGDPADVYADGYAELNSFFTDIVNQYEIRLEPNKYIRAQKKIFNESLIDRIKRVLPSRATFEDVGIEFKPTLLEKNKIKGYKLGQERLDYLPKFEPNTQQELGIKILNDGDKKEDNTVINISDDELQDVSVTEQNIGKTAQKLIRFGVSDYITSSAEYNDNKSEIKITSFNPIDDETYIAFSASKENIYTTTFNFFNQNDDSASLRPFELGKGRDIISSSTDFERYNSFTVEDLKYHNNNKITSSHIQGVNIIGHHQMSGSWEGILHSSSIAFRDEVSNLFNYIDPNVNWGTTVNDTHFVNYADFRNTEKGYSTMKLLNRSHYETRYKFLTIGDTQIVSASSLSATGSVFTPFASESFFRGIENIQIDSTNGVRENGSTVRLIDTNAEGGIQNTNTGSNFGKYIDERYRYPNNHTHIVGKSNTETPSFKNSFFDGVQNGAESDRDDVVFNNVPETADLNSGSFYTVNVTGENTLTVG